MTTPTAKQVCLKILDYLETKEDETTKKWRVWAHNEFDSNQTNFEMLSNQRAIGLVTTLKGKYLGVLMTIFQSMFDRNFYIFDYLVESKDFSIDMSGRGQHRGRRMQREERDCLRRIRHSVDEKHASLVVVLSSLFSCPRVR